MAKSTYKPADENNKPFLLIGTFRNDKIKNEIHLSGMSVISKNLTSSPQNWDKINAFLEKKKYDIACVALSLSESVLLIAQCDAYKDKFKKMLNIIKDIPHMIFLYEDNRFAKFNIFNTSYYKKYLFYDEFFNNRELYNNSTSSYCEYDYELQKDIATDYLYEILLPAAFLAEEKEWKSLKSNHHLHYLGAFRQLTLFEAFDEKNEEKIDLEKAYITGKFINDLRSEIALSEKERILFYSLDGNERIQFIDNKCQSIRRSLKERLLNNPDNKNTIDSIEQLLTSDDFQGRTMSADNWKEQEWKLFEIYLKEKRFNEDQEIQKAQKNIKELIEDLYTMQLNILVYKFSNDIVRYIREFIESENQSVVFRSYILKDRIWENELESFLSLFQEYVVKIKGVNLSFEQRKTDIGTLYVILSSNKEVVKSEFPQYISELNSFLEYCDKNIEKAKEVLRSYNCSEIEITKYICEFQKKTRRLLHDMRQSYELKILEYRHILENDALERRLPSNSYSLTQELPERLVPSLVIENVNMVSLNDTTAPIFFGDCNYNENDHQLLDYIVKLVGDKKELEGELLVLKDEKVGKKDKASAFNKIKTFLSNHALEIGELAFKALSKYIESLL